MEVLVAALRGDWKRSRRRSKGHRRPPDGAGILHSEKDALRCSPTALHELCEIANSSEPEQPTTSSALEHGVLLYRKIGSVSGNAVPFTVMDFSIQRSAANRSTPHRTNNGAVPADVGVALQAEATRS